MKILAIFHHPEIIGGVEKRFLEIAKVWNKLCYLDVVESCPTINPSCHQIYEVKAWGGSSHLKSWNWIRQVSKIRGNYDVVFAVDNRFTNVIPAYNLAKKLKCKMIITDQHFTFPIPYSFFKTYRGYRRQGYHMVGAFLSTVDVCLLLRKMRNADLHIAVSNYIANCLLKLNVPSKNIVKTTSGVDVAFIDGVDIQEKKFDACFCGRLHREKGIFNLIQIWSIVKSRKENAKLVIIGTGRKNVISKLRMLIKDLDLTKNVLMVGYVNEKEKIRLMKQSKIFVSSSFYEGGAPPLALLEASACRLAPVVSDIPAHREGFDESIALFVPPSSILSFAKAIISLLDRPNEIRRRGDNARKLIGKRFTWNEIAKRELEIINRLLMEENK